jgi:NAD(P)H dehydrogenase (quinone)
MRMGMVVLVVYDSLTGNTEKMASCVAEGARSVEGTTAVVKKAEEATLDDLLASHAIILGSPTYYGLMSSKLKDLLDKSAKIHGKLAGKVGAAFTSAGGTATGAETCLLSMLQALLIHGMIIQGRADNKHYGPACVEAPDEEAREYCRELGKRTAVLAALVTR